MYLPTKTEIQVKPLPVHCIHPWNIYRVNNITTVTDIEMEKDEAELRFILSFLEESSADIMNVWEEE